MWVLLVYLFPYLSLGFWRSLVRAPFCFCKPESRYSSMCLWQSTGGRVPYPASGLLVAAVAKMVSFHLPMVRRTASESCPAVAVVNA